MIKNYKNYVKYLREISDPKVIYQKKLHLIDINVKKRIQYFKSKSYEKLV